MLLRDITVSTVYDHPFQLRFNKEMWSITDLYLKCLGKYNTYGVSKILVRLDDQQKNENKIEHLLNVIIVNKKFDFVEYFKQNKDQRKKMMLDILQLGVIDVAKTQKMSMDKFLDAYNCCLKKQLKNEWLRKNKYLMSPNKKWYAGIYCTYDIDFFRTETIFLNSDKKEIGRVKLFSTEPHQVEEMGKMQWDSTSETFVLYSRDEKNSWGARVPNPEGVVAS